MLGELIRDAVLAGQGIALHSLWHVHKELADGRLEVVLPHYTLPESSIWAVMPQRRLVPPRVRAFTDFLIEKLGDPPPWERQQRRSAGLSCSLASITASSSRACPTRPSLRETLPCGVDSSVIRLRRFQAAQHHARFPPWPSQVVTVPENAGIHSM